MFRERSMALPSRLVTVRSKSPTAEIKTAGEIENCINFERDSIFRDSIPLKLSHESLAGKSRKLDRFNNRNFPLTITISGEPMSLALIRKIADN